MARLIKCPRCQSQIDVTSVSGGATVRCPDCGSMVRVPTGNTGVHQKVAAPVPAAAASSSKGDTRVRTGGRQTELFRKMSGVRGPAERPGRERQTSVRRQGSNTGLIIGGAVGGVALIGILIFAMMNKQAGEQKAKEDRVKQNEAARKQNEANFKEQARLDAEAAKEEADMKAAAKEGKKPLLQKSGGGYKAPDTFEPGIDKFIPRGIIEEVAVDAKLYQEFEGLLTSGKTADIAREEAKWFPCMVKGIATENERVARGSLQCIMDFCSRKGLTTESGKPAVTIELFNSAQWRAGEYQRWNEWYIKNKGKLETASAPGAAPGARAFASEDPEKANWADLLMKARAGGGFDDPTTQEGNSFGRIQAMGPGAYPKLVEFIDHEDTGLGRAAVTILNRLTGSNSPLPNEANRAQIKAEWAAKYKK